MRQNKLFLFLFVVKVVQSRYLAPKASAKTGAPVEVKQAQRQSGTSASALPKAGTRIVKKENVRQSAVTTRPATSEVKAAKPQQSHTTSSKQNNDDLELLSLQRLQLEYLSAFNEREFQKEAEFAENKLKEKMQKLLDEKRIVNQMKVAHEVSLSITQLELFMEEITRVVETLSSGMEDFGSALRCLVRSLDFVSSLLKTDKIMMSNYGNKSLLRGMLTLRRLYFWSRVLPKAP